MSEGHYPSFRMVVVLFFFLDHASPGLVGRLFFRLKELRKIAIFSKDCLTLSPCGGIIETY